MKKIIALFVLVCGIMSLQAQVITLGVSTQTSVTGCSVSVYDNGGINGDYSPNMDNYVTICSTDPTNHSVRVNLDLASFDVDCSDTLFIYDGQSINDPLLVALTNCITDSISSPTLSYAATVYNTSGCLTIRFKTDGADEGAGFAITTDCVRPCQRINVSLDTVLSNKYPKIDTSDGYLYLDVCPYDTIHLVAKGDYIDNDYSYHQSDPTSTFHWDMSWEIIDSLGGNAIDYLFPEGRGYDVAISISDSAGCFSYIPYTFRVRTSSNPIREVLDFPSVCAGSEVQLTVGYDFLSALQVDTVGSEQLTALAVCDTIFLPDGVPCDNGTQVSGLQYCSYISPVTFTSFSPTATIQSPNDILFVRVKIEHSFIGDIWIRLTCPNQQFVSILKKYNGGSSGCSSQIPASEWGWNGSGNSGAYLGQAYDYGDNDKCNPNLPQNAMGIPWNYCWSNATNQGYVYHPANYVYAAGSSGQPCDSTNVAMMTNVYHPDGSFANLIGCPMNGTWSIEVMDGYSIDNGWMTEWEIALDPALLPQDWSYNVLVDSSWVLGPGADGPVVIPDSAGFITYQLYVQDELGCIYDTINHMEVVGHPEPDLGPDYNICYGDITVLAANYTQGGAEGQTTLYQWNTGDETDSIEVLTAGEYFVHITTTSESGLTCDGSDTINIGIFERPVLDFDAPELSGCAPLNVRIQNNSTPEDGYYEWYIFSYDDYGNQHLAYSSLERNPVFQFNDPGTYSIAMKVTTQDGCKDSVTLYNAIVVNPQPIAEFEADPSISMLSESGGVINFINYADQSMVTGANGSFYWDFGDGTIDSVNFADPHTYTTWGDYNVTLHVQSNSGCSSEITHTIVIESDLIFPNIITPNGDGINDVWAIENLNTNINPEDPDGYRNNRLMIYDRWGKKVYDAKNYDTYAKDGTIYPGNQFFDGSGLNDGVYYYSFQYKGKAKTITFNGSITIVR